MQDGGENLRSPAVKRWLDSLPEPPTVQDGGTGSPGSMFPAWRRKELMKTTCLQGNKCFVKPMTSGNEFRENKTTSESTIPKRVTFNTNGDEDDDEEDDDDTRGDANVQSDFRLMRRQADRNRLELASSMNRHLIGVHQRKVFERARPFVYEFPERGSPRVYGSSRNQADQPIQEPGGCEQKDDRQYIQPYLPKIMDSSLSGGSSSVSRKQSRGSPKLDLVCVSMTTKRPMIGGLVVDLVSNQNPSMVRASKNANIREEFALQQKISGYRAACTHTIKTIKMAQRRLTTGLHRLRRKMAQNKMDEKQMSEFRNTSDQLFLRNKGYMPTSKDSMAHFWYPPLNYQRRRMMTVQ